MYDELVTEHFALHSSLTPSSVGESSENDRPVGSSRPGRSAHSDGSPRTPETMMRGVLVIPESSKARAVFLPYPDRIEVHAYGGGGAGDVKVAKRSRVRIRMFIFAALYSLLLSGLLGLNILQTVCFVGLCELATIAWVKR